MKSWFHHSINPPKSYLYLTHSHTIHNEGQVVTKETKQTNNFCQSPVLGYRFFSFLIVVQEIVIAQL